MKEREAERKEAIKAARKAEKADEAARKAEKAHEAAINQLIVPELTDTESEDESSP